jgi:hypothetical protein
MSRSEKQGYDTASAAPAKLSIAFAMLLILSFGIEV